MASSLINMLQLSPELFWDLTLPGVTPAKNANYITNGFIVIQYTEKLTLLCYFSLPPEMTSANIIYISQHLSS